VSAREAAVDDASLLSDLDAVGIALVADGEALLFQTPPSVSIGPFVARIMAHKPVLLAALRQRELEREGELLERGWTWLEEHPNDPRHEAFEARWIERLRRYERSSAEAVSAGLESTLPRAHVYQGPVEATAPPPDWDRTLPETCGWSHLCQVLGPCPRSLAGGPCRRDVP
jgi:hypothetical protein